MKKKEYDDDDGRTIADMSDLPSPGFFKYRSFKKHGTFSNRDGSDEENKEKLDLSDDEKKGYIGGALAATLLVGAIFAGAGALVIFLITLLGH